MRADVPALRQHFKQYLSSQRQPSDEQNGAVQLLVDEGNKLGRILFDRRKRAIASRVSVQYRQDDMLLFLQELCRLAIVPPCQSAAMKQKDGIFAAPAVFPEFHGPLPPH